MQSLLGLLVTLLQLYTFVVFASVVMSWLVAFNVVNRHNQFVNMIGTVLYNLTEPALRPIRRVLPNLGGIDLSPVVLILALWFARSLLIEYWPR